MKSYSEDTFINPAAETAAANPSTVLVVIVTTLEEAKLALPARDSATVNESPGVKNTPLATVVATTVGDVVVLL